MISAANTGSSSSEETISTTDSEFFVTYKDSDGNEKKEPACEVCVQRFTFSDRQREILERSLEFAFAHEDFSVAHWRMTTGWSGRSDWDCYWLLEGVLTDLRKSQGLYGMSFEHLRALCGCVHLAVAADVIPPGERDQAIELLRCFSRFGGHLHKRHRSDTGPNIGYDVVDTLDKPRYVGSLNLEGAWLLSSRLRGKTMDEIGDELRAKLDGTPEWIRANLATAHSGRETRLPVLETALYNTVSVIQANAEEWVKRAKESMVCPDVGYLAREVHNQVFAVDELLAMGCHSGDPKLNSIDGHKLYRAIDGIRELVDWDECPALKQRMDQAEQTLAKPGIGRDGDEDDGW